MITDKYIYVDALITTDGSNNLLPTDYMKISTIKFNIIRAINALKAGQTVLLQTLYRCLYKYGGVDTIILRLGGVDIETEKPILSHSNVYCDEDQKAVGYNVNIDFYMGKI